MLPEIIVEGLTTQSPIRAKIIPVEQKYHLPSSQRVSDLDRDEWLRRLLDGHVGLRQEYVPLQKLHLGNA